MSISRTKGTHPSASKKSPRTDHKNYRKNYSGNVTHLQGLSNLPDGQQE